MAVVLTYFDARGRAEIIRAALSFAKIPFEEVDMRTQAEFAKLKEGGKLLFGTVPLLEIDGLVLTQVSAIMRYICDKAGFTPSDRAKVDMLYDAIADWGWNYALPMGIPVLDVPVRKKVTEKLQPKYLPVFNKLLEENGTGHLVGSSLTMADIGLVEILFNIDDYMGIQTLDPYPALKAAHCVEGHKQLERNYSIWSHHFICAA